MMRLAKAGTARGTRIVLSSPVYDAIKERVMDQAYAPGARLTIDTIATELGTSPTPVREALTRLAAEGLVRSEPFKGYSVMPLLDQRQFAELMHVRRLLEVDAVRLAAPRIILADLRVMERALEAMVVAEPEPTFGAYRDYNQQDRIFHETMIAASENSVLVETYRTLHSHTLLARLYRGRGEVDHQESVREHRVIIDALRARDAEAAGEAARQHIDGVENRLGAILDHHLEQAEPRTGPASPALGHDSDTAAAAIGRGRRAEPHGRSTTMGEAVTRDRERGA